MLQIVIFHLMFCISIHVHYLGTLHFRAVDTLSIGLVKYYHSKIALAVTLSHSPPHLTPHNIPELGLP